MCVQGLLLCGGRGAGVACAAVVVAMVLGLAVSLLDHHLDLLGCVATLQQQLVLGMGAEM